MRSILAASLAALLTCVPVAAQNVAKLPAASTLTGAEKLPAVQGSGCATAVAPCATVAISPAQVATYLAPSFQAKDADLDAIAALATQTFGRSLLTQADAAAVRSAIGLGSLATQSGTFSGSSSGTNTGDQTSVTGNAGTATKLATARTINGVAFDGTANIAIADTAIAGAAWTTYSPTVTAASGALTTVSADGAYRCIGKSCNVEVNIVISANGTGAARVVVSLPFPARRRFALPGREIAATGVSLVGSIDSGSTMDVTTYSGGYPGGSNYILVVSGTYEIQ